MNYSTHLSRKHSNKAAYLGNPGLIPLVIVALVTLFLQLTSSTALAAPDPPQKQIMDVRGIAITSWGWDNYGYQSARSAVDYARSLGATDVSFSTELLVNVDTHTVYDGSTPSKPLTGANANLEAIARYAKSLGLRVSIKPHFLNSVTKNMLGAAEDYMPRNLDTFFSTYGAAVVAHAQVAARAGSDYLIIGTEMGAMTSRNRDRWAKVVADARAVFKGQLGYASLFSPDSITLYGGPDEASIHCFWDLLDFAGIDLYPALSRSDVPTVSEAVSGYFKDIYAQNIVQYVLAFQQKVQKPVVFTELGFRSQVRAAEDTSSWDNGMPSNNTVQANLINASRQVWSAQIHPGIRGFFYWELPVITREDNFFGVRGKPESEAALKSWLTGN